MHENHDITLCFIIIKYNNSILCHYFSCLFHCFNSIYFVFIIISFQKLFYFTLRAFTLFKRKSTLFNLLLYFAVSLSFRGSLEIDIWRIYVGLEIITSSQSSPFSRYY